MARQKMMQLSKELGQMVDAIESNPKYTSEKKKLERIISSWKMIHTKYIMSTSDTYALCIMYAFQSAVSYHLYELEYEKAILFVLQVISTMKEV